MSAASSRGSVASTSDSNKQVTASSSNAKPTSTGVESSPPTSTPPAPPMFAMSNGSQVAAPLTRSYAKQPDSSDTNGGPPNLLISSAAVSPAKTSASPAGEPDSQAENDQASSSSTPESLTLFSPLAGGSSLRTYPDYFPANAAEISDSYSRRWPASGFTTSPGECWTADTSESPNAGAVSSSLRDVLEDNVPAKYFLSPKAAAGILRRAEKRGRELPGHLAEALEAVAGHRTRNA